VIPETDIRFDQRRESTRLMVVCTSALALLALVAAASGAVDVDESNVGSVGASGMVSIVVALGAIVGIAVVVAAAHVLLTLITEIEPNATLAKRSWRRELFAMVVVVGVLLALTALAPRGGLPHAEHRPDAPTNASRPARGARNGTETVDWWLVALLVGAVGVVGGTTVWSIARAQRNAPTLTALDDGAVAAAAEVTLHAVLAEPDPRHAVILAYQRMEWSLERAGVPRSAWETPFEYLDRVFLALGAPTAVAATLTELYERAKFAHHPVTVEMRDAAIDALAELADEMRVAR
jgi:hypothetical protein